VLVHDENRDKQAQDLKKAVADATIADTVGGMEKSFSDMATLEETRAKERAAYLFEQELRVVSRATSLESKYDPDKATTDGLHTVVDARLKKLLGRPANADDLKRYRANQVRIRARLEARDQSFTVFLGAVGHRFDSCQAVYAQSAAPAIPDDKPSSAFLDSLPVDRRDTALQKFSEVVETCKKLDETLTERAKFFGGGTQSQLEVFETRSETLQKELADYDRELGAARAKLRVDQRAIPASADPSNNLQRVEDRAKRLGEVVRTLADGLGALSAPGGHALAVERLARLEALLGSIAGTPTDAKVTLSDDDRVAVAIIRDLPALADEADKLLKDAARPRLVPFVAAVEQQKIVVRGFEAVRAAKLKRLDAARKQVAAAGDEGDALVRVLDTLERNAIWKTRSIATLLADLQDRQRTAFLRALAVYADEVKAYRVEGAALAARVDAITYEEGLARSKFAAAQWDALIDMMATVLADYHAAGIKKADLAEFFKALGLVTIGVGVAQ